MVGSQLTFNNIWNSKLVGRVAVALFFVILLVNALFSAMSLSQFQKDRLYDLRELGLYSIIPALSNDIFDQSQPPIDHRGASRLILITPINGIAYYDYARQKLGEEGQRFTIQLSPRDSRSDQPEFYDTERGVYEVTYTPQELGVNYYITAQLDASRIQTEIARAIQLEIVIVILLSLFVTLVLILTLSKWFLDPVLNLYKRLMMGIQNPENPPKPDKNLHDKTEIGLALEAADKLMISNAESIRQIKAMAESEVNRLAYYDSLTGLPNRAYFIKSLKETLALADKAVERYAVLTMDIDHFKDINDTMGHAVGDEVLKAFAERLQDTVPETAVIARSGEDEFSVMMPIVTKIEEAEVQARQIVEAFRSDAINVMEEDFQVRCSIGFTIVPDDADLAEDALKCADIALNKAKEDGRDQAKRYENTYTDHIQKRFEILRDLRIALEKQDLELYYQPQMDLKTGKITGAEALIRWWRVGEAGGGHFVSPADFIPVAEQSGLILPLGDWILRKACETVKSWNANGLEGLTLAVNVSGHQFLEKDIVHKIERTLIETGINPQQLEIEVTESVFMEDTEHSIKMLKAIQDMGVTIAIDDFGTGYSSLSYLQRFPMDKLKIDRAFVRHLDEQHDNLVLTKTIIALCKTMGLKVVAEGVERAEEEKILIQEGCQIAQGFRYSPPIPDTKFRKFVKDYSGKLSDFG